MKKVIKLFRLVMVMVVLLCPSLMSAQTVGTTYIVERGETLQSISQKYGVTEQQIINQNPDAAQFIYVGMELSIPVTGKKSNSTFKNIESETIVQTGSDTQPTEKESGTTLFATPVEPQEDNKFWSHTGLAYVTNFDNFDKGFYAYYFDVISKSGWGACFLVGTNLGLCKPAEMLGRVGPVYAVAIHDNTQLSFPLCFNMTTFDVTEETRVANNGEIITKKEMKVAYGVSITPKVTFKVDRVKLGFGLDINHIFKKKVKSTTLGYTEEHSYFGKTNLGLILSIGF